MNSTVVYGGAGPNLNSPGVIAAIFTITIIIIIIVIGNFLVILAVIRDPRLRSQLQNWFIVSLAGADFLVGLLIMPFSLTFELLEVWTFGLVWCELWLALDVLFVTASILNLCIISLDRYWSITKPFDYVSNREPGKVLLMIAGVWGTAFMISFPPLVGWRPDRYPGTCELSHNVGYVLYSACGSFYIPVIILLIVNFRILMIAKKRSNQQFLAAVKSERRIANSTRKR